MIYTVYNVITKTPLITIGNTGIGKSEISNFIKKNFKDIKVLNTISQASLKQISTEISNYNGIIFVDDIGAINTDYMRITTVSTLTYLAYQHYLRRLDSTTNVEINNFNGAVIMNMQPAIYNQIIHEPSFEANIKDKTYRYFILNLPNRNIELKHPKIKELQHIYDKFNDIKVNIDENKVNALADNMLYNMSGIRRKQLITKYVKLTAILNNHDTAMSEDYQFVAKLLLNNIIENELTERIGVKSAFTFNVFGYNLLLMAKKYGNMFKVIDMVKDTGISKRTIYRKAKEQNIQIDNGYIIYNDNLLMRVVKHVI